MRFLVVFLACAAALTTQAQSISSRGALPDAPQSHLSEAAAAPVLLAAETTTFSASTRRRDPASDSTDFRSSISSSSSSSSLTSSSRLTNSSSLIATFEATAFQATAFQGNTANFYTAAIGQTSAGQGTAKPATNGQAKTSAPADEEQPKRILGLMPNYRAVSAGVRPPPPGPKESFMIATENNFDYSQFVFVGLTSLLAESTNTHPEFGKGVGGYWSYYWRGYIDKSDGDYLILFVFPTLFHEDERYFAMGQGSFWKRAEYSGMSVFITPNYHGKNTFNWAEILGRGVSQAVSLTYYPSEVATPSSYFSKFGYAVGRDALTNVFREFYPDIARTVFKPFHRKKTQKES